MAFTTRTCLLFIGESPPLDSPSGLTLPDSTIGTRLAILMLGLKDRDTMLAHTDHTNVFATPRGQNGGAPKWDDTEAQHIGGSIAQKAAAHGVHTIVALGRRVAIALGMPDPLNCPSYNWAPAPLTTWRLRVTSFGDSVTVIYTPGPSSETFTTMQDPALRTDVRAALIPELVIACPTLRPWHFRLDEPAALAALSAAVSPLCPALGAGALTLAAGMHVAHMARLALPVLAPSVKPAVWDMSLSMIAWHLLQDDGARKLSLAWHHGEARMATAIVNAAKPYITTNAMQSPNTMRATLARYREAGLA